MALLNNEDKWMLRGKYERLDPVHQGGLPSADPTLKNLPTEEILAIFEENDQDWQKWPTLTDLEDHIRNLATLKSYGI